ncbi:LppX_LprAFG lipoprotein [Actinomadura barringtoniae]|uniref:LppX_LprAFG lipoprotein n=1 Tax=Actinomadura barringtoniae TaxID=1427535 RepID=A0A939PDB0_9ACTN|nr:LppX_LprAFG lipoprotein [Actinomadura barringtoniae]MBO2446386.1 LppX_LprAFG lipoprotein [Actinomadura barringtoniae]
MSRRRVRLVAIAPVALALTLSACNGGDDKGSKVSANQPQGQATLQQASTAMAGLKSIAFTLSTEGKPSIPVKSGDIKLLKSGDAEGTLTISQLGKNLEMKVVALGDQYYVKGLTGNWQKFSKAMASTVFNYDPSAVLDPDRGIPKLLNSVSAPTTEATEKVNGKDAYRIKATLTKDAVGGLIPGVDSNIQGLIWVGKADHRLLKVKGDLPAGPDGDKGSVIINFTEFDAPYQIKAPQ